MTILVEVYMCLTCGSNDMSSIESSDEKLVVSTCHNCNRMYVRNNKVNDKLNAAMNERAELAHQMRMALTGGPELVRHG